MRKKRRGPRPRGLVKKTITMSKEREALIRKAVAKGEAPNASAYIEQALDAYASVQSYDEFLAEWRREVGPPTPEETAWAREAIERVVRPRRRRAG
jgi:Arc/MetJ-type ribon-helix-helix transcriptional regulator